MSREAWHPYVFDLEARRFVGDFEGMYRAEVDEGFDSWHQSDPRRLDAQVSRLLLDQITYRTAIDLGCGKGHSTVALKRRDNQVVGVDVAPTAIALARGAFPDVDFVCADVPEYLREADPVDLIVIRELLSYLSDWRDVLALAAARAHYLLISLFIPPEAIGAVKSHVELDDELRGHAEVLEAVMLETRRLGLWLCRTTG